MTTILNTLASYLVGYVIYTALSSVLPPDGDVVIMIVIPIILLIITLVAFDGIEETLKAQINDLNQLDEYEKDKATYKAQLADYIQEIKQLLTKDLPQFEKDLMASVKDSKLLAAHLEKNNYSETLTSYCEKIADIQRDIHSCDRSTSTTITKLLTRQQHVMRHAMFIPAKYQYKKEEAIETN